VIRGFADQATEDFFHGVRSAKARRIPRDIAGIVERKLDMLNAAARLDDLRVPPGNRLEALRGDYAGHHSVRVNDQWRLVFRWVDGGAEDVALVDYH
jgi:proteic killer suppression protein